MLICSNCHKKGHSSEKCWHKIGFPDWYNKNNRKASAKPSSFAENQSRWNAGRQHVKMSNNTFQSPENKQTESTVHITASQLEQLLKLLPNNSKSQDFDDELESFSGMVTCISATSKAGR